MFSPSLQNSTVNMICGDNGITKVAGYVGASTFEKDGSMHNFRFFGAYTPSAGTTSHYMNIDESTVYGVLQPFYPSLARS